MNDAKDDRLFSNISLKQEWFYKPDLQAPRAICCMFQVFFKEDSLGLYGIELIVVGSADATPFREHLRSSIKSMFYLFINHIHSVPEYKLAFSPWVLLCSTHICESRKSEIKTCNDA